jgi:hypothetical protein
LAIATQRWVTVLLREVDGALGSPGKKPVLR